MPYRLDAFSDVGLDEALLRLVLDEHATKAVPRLDRLWTYFRNPSTDVGVGGLAGVARASGLCSRPRLGQERGLPSRLTGRGYAASFSFLIPSECRTSFS